MDLQQLQRLVDRYAVALQVPAPRIRIIDDPDGPFYQPLQHRLNMDLETLALEDGAVAAITAHEMGHACQRRSLLTEFVLTLGTLFIAVAVVPPVVALEAFSGLWRGVAFLAVLQLCLEAYKAFWGNRTDYRALERELEADEISAHFCGASVTLAALDATIAKYGAIEFQGERRDALLGLMHEED
jgi:Zn-dependent protease with chaperone function